MEGGAGGRAHFLSFVILLMVSSYQTAGEKGARDDYHLIPREEQLTATWTLTGIRSGAETRAADSHVDTNRHKVREQRGAAGSHMETNRHKVNSRDKSS